MTSSIITHSLNGVTIGQRATDGFINATALCRASNLLTGERKDVSEWLSNKSTKSALDKLSVNTGIPVFNLVNVKKGKHGGTWIHPRLSVRFAMWLNDDFSLQVEDWVHEWRLTGKNPIEPQSSGYDLERLEERLSLKNVARLALTDVCKEWMEYHGWYDNKPRVGKYFATLFDGMNIALTTETSQQMMKRLGAARGKPMKSDELIRDYFSVEALRLYLCTHNVLTNTLLDLPTGHRDAMKYLQASVKLALPKSFFPKRIEFKLLPYNHQQQLLLK